MQDGKKPSNTERFFMLNEESVYKPLLAGAVVGGVINLFQTGNIAKALGGAIGGAILFAVIWRIVRFFRG